MTTLNLPTKITIARLLLGLAGLLCLFTPAVPYNYVVAGIIFVVSALGDVLDGYLARRLHQVSSLGAMLDAVADKLLILPYFAYLQAAGLYPLWLLEVVLVREIIVNSCRSYLISKQPIVGGMKGGKLKGIFQGVSLLLGLLYLITVADQSLGLPLSASFLKEWAFITMMIGFLLSLIVFPSEASVFRRLLPRRASDSV